MLTPDANCARPADGIALSQREIRKAGIKRPPGGGKIAPVPRLVTRHLSPARCNISGRSLNMGRIGLPELLIILAIIIVIFGANRLPGLGKGIGSAIKNFKDGLKDEAADHKS
jgi:sec-independent protein translocase protein TatA